MKLVVIESPYAGKVKRNLDYARKCVKDSLKRGEAPIASHLLYTQKGILNDDLLCERTLGINAGLEWLKVAEKHVFYIDYGMSCGMTQAEKYSKNLGIEIEYRKILARKVTKKII